MKPCCEEFVQLRADLDLLIGGRVLSDTEHAAAERLHKFIEDADDQHAEDAWRNT